MKISALVSKLNAIKAKEGDIEVGSEIDESVESIAAMGALQDESAQVHPIVRMTERARGSKPKSRINLVKVRELKVGDTFRQMGAPEKVEAITPYGTSFHSLILDTDLQKGIVYDKMMEVELVVSAHQCDLP